MKGLTTMEKKVIEEKANKILSEYKDCITDDSFVDIVDIARKNGFFVGQSDLDDNEDGFIIVDLTRDFILGIKTHKLIVVNKNRDFNLRRFIVAHEIGHYFLENEKCDKSFASREHKTGKSEHENDIDYFAACLLMPRDNFIKKYYELKCDISDSNLLTLSLSKLFGVTNKTCERRFEELDLIK